MVDGFGNVGDLEFEGISVGGGDGDVDGSPGLIVGFGVVGGGDIVGEIVYAAGDDIYFVGVSEGRLVGIDDGYCVGDGNDGGTVGDFVGDGV